MNRIRASLPTLSALGAGLVFGIGLAVAGMTDPAKVQGFLDVTGGSRWDPTLAFVMIGAIAVHASLGWLIRRRSAPLFVRRFALPTRTDLDPKLIGGAALFGVGWGLGGICPGPALVDLGSGIVPALVFVIAMALGMTLQRLTSREGASGPSTPTSQPTSSAPVGAGRAPPAITSQPTTSAPVGAGLAPPAITSQPTTSAPVGAGLAPPAITSQPTTSATGALP